MSAQDQNQEVADLFAGADGDALSELSDIQDLGEYQEEDIAVVEPKAKPARFQAKPRKKRREEDHQYQNDGNYNEQLAEFDQVVNQFKGQRKVVRDLQDETEGDELIAQICDSMKEATAQDIESNVSRQPAIARLKLLPAVESLLRKSYLHDQIGEHTELFEAIRQWLEPLPDKSLPNLNIRKSLMELLYQLPPLDPEIVRESRIGRVVMFYAKNERDLPAIRKIATELIYSWSKSLLKQNQYIPSKKQPVAEVQKGGRNRVGDVYENSNRARIPQASRGQYIVQPTSQINGHQQVSSQSSALHKKLKSKQ